MRSRYNFRLYPDAAQRLYLAKIGDVEVRWSRALPAVPSSVTVIKDAGFAISRS
ncbi:helix-turn-helix domain-containing protein [Sphaerisporangium perillae]|uniref:helix-turn-helix domain-containing protein n=1 Tax=Sphaerisporangium perillae TaxID=2935860 RepID=UPI0035584DF5